MKGLGRTLILCTALLAGCANQGADEEEPQEQPQPPVTPNPCHNPLDASTKETTGLASIFDIDPIVSSEDPGLEVGAPLAEFTSIVSLERLEGRGVLKGENVDIRNQVDCLGVNGYWAYSETNEFEAKPSDTTFQEPMTYYYGDRYLQFLKDSEVPAGGMEFLPLRIIAACLQPDNAYYVYGTYADGSFGEEVCMGYAYREGFPMLADDATVTVHEIQHGVTKKTYAAGNLFRTNLGSLGFDEAGALNEALSDFMSLIYLELPSGNPLDEKVFSRWALGKYFGGDGSRGAHACPKYDSRYPLCSATEDSFSADDGKITFTYPDGLGWPFSYDDNTANLRQIFRTFTAREGIHYAGSIMEGALWDAYEATRGLWSSDSIVLRQRWAKAIMQTLLDLPKPDDLDLSPVGFVDFSTKLLETLDLLEWSAQEKQAVQTALNNRELLTPDQVGASWLGVGVGSLKTPGVKVEDNRETLLGWLGGNTILGQIIGQGPKTGLNNVVDAGEVVVVFFDLANNSSVSAGGVRVVVESQSSHVKVLNGNYNWGYLTETQSEVQLLKVNGSDLVTDLSSTDASKHVPTGTSYFATNPYYSQRDNTGIWIKVKKSAQPGETLNFDVSATPKNGPTETVQFQLQVNGVCDSCN